MERKLHATCRGAQRQLVLGAALSAVLVTAGCSHKVAAGHVNGTLWGVSIGSPVGLPPQRLSGEIVLTDDTGRVTKVQAGANGTYHVSLPAGSYILKAWVAGDDIRQRPVELKTGMTLHVDFPAR